MFTAMFWVKKMFVIIVLMFIKNKSENSSSDQPINQNPNFIAVKAPLNPPQNEDKGKKFSIKSLSKKQKIIIGIVIGVLIIGGAGIFVYKKKTAKKPKVETPVVQQPKIEEPPKTSEPSRLTGIEVPLENNKRTATGIMIENSPDARPQSGLKDAGVVYEAVAEGGITRFMAVFQDNLPEYVGPVRSVRPYYLDFVAPYDAGIAHVGGSAQALQQLRNEGIKDLDQMIASNTKAFWRENSRRAPHNMYTNVVKLKDLEQQKGWTSNYEGFVRGGEDKASATPNAKAIEIRMSSANYRVNYQYDPANNNYLRSEGGKPHMDAKSSTQLTPKVIIVPIITRTQNGIYSVYATTGSGKVLVFQNGTVTEGTWSKEGRKNQFKFTGSDGQPIKLAPGQTWVTVASSAGDVTFAP